MGGGGTVGTSPALTWKSNAIKIRAPKIVGKPVVKGSC
jgi:hypothetical protein